MSEALHIRQARVDDLDALYEICLRTGAAGADASDLTADPRLIGEIYAAPYPVLEPDHAWALDDGHGSAVGYVLGALDSRSFEARCEAHWWPALRERYPEGSGNTPLDELLVALIHHRSPKPDPVVATHPSHLHIDLLPEVQGQGWGRRLIDTLFDGLRAAGSAGVHWGVSTRNHNAIAFYDHLGCRRLADDGITLTFGVLLG